MGNSSDSRTIKDLVSYYLDEYDEMGATSNNSDFKLETIVRMALSEERERCAVIAERMYESVAATGYSMEDAGYIIACEIRKCPPER